MQISLKPWLSVLARRGGNIPLAILRFGDTAGRNTPAGVSAVKLPDGRMMYCGMFGGVDTLANFLATNSLVPEYWIELREYRDFLEEHVKVDGRNNRYVEVLTGPLEGAPFSYVAVQATRYDDILEELVDLNVECAHVRLVRSGLAMT